MLILLSSSSRARAMCDGCASCRHNLAVGADDLAHDGEAVANVRRRWPQARRLIGVIVAHSGSGLPTCLIIISVGSSGPVPRAGARPSQTVLKPRELKFAAERSLRVEVLEHVCDVHDVA